MISDNVEKNFDIFSLSLNIYTDKITATNKLNINTPVLEIKAVKAEIDTSKRFLKLLMSRGIQRNDAQRIVEKYHKKNGTYTYLDVLVEWRNLND